LQDVQVDRLARRILAAVVLFVLMVAGILVTRSRTVQTEPVGPPPSPADLNVKEVQLREESAGGGRWHLSADQASVFSAEGRTAFRNVQVQVWDRQRAWTIVGEEGDFFKSTGSVEVRRSVVVVSDDGLRLETSVLRWDGAQRRLWTDAPVRIYRPGAVIDGRALDVRMAEEVTTVQGPVRATFTHEPRP
jgi:LPS export ABC transporter protein LptC